MAHQFRQHYSLAEARALLPQVRQWLREILRLRQELPRRESRLSKLTEAGFDLGGEPVEKWVKTLANLRGLLHEFQKREIQIKDLERGLIDFPAFVGGREVFLCWEEGEEDIEFWHDLETGYSGREKL